MPAQETLVVGSRVKPIMPIDQTEPDENRAPPEVRSKLSRGSTRRANRALPTRLCELQNPKSLKIGNRESQESMSSESETSENPEAECKRAVTVHEQVVGAIKALGSRNGSSRDEIVDYLVSRGLMQPKIAKALVAKALYKALDEGLVKRPGGSKLYRISTSRRRRHRGQHHGPRKSAHGEKRRRAERRKDGKRRHRCHK